MAASRFHDQSNMPRKFLRRWSPDPEKIRRIKGLGWLKPVLRDPYLFHMNRRSVSLAFFAGVFCAFLPIPGQTLTAALLALWWRANLPISMTLIWVTNPITMPPILYANYELGRWVLGKERIAFHFEMSFNWLITEAQAIWWPLLTGSLIAGLVMGFFAWLAIRVLWQWQVVRSWEARKLNRQRAKAMKEQAMKDMPSHPVE